LEVGKKFISFTTSLSQQQLTLQYGIRPADTSIDITSDESILNQNYGVNPSITPDTIHSLPYPQDDVIEEVLNMFYSVKKPTYVLLLIDVSGSMGTDGKLTEAIASAVQFIDRMLPQDQLIIIIFSDVIQQLDFGTNISNISVIRDAAINILQNDVIAGGPTNLYAATIEAVQKLSAIKTMNDQNNILENYVMVILSDGDNDDGTATITDVYDILPSGEDPSSIHIYTIAYGEDLTTDGIDFLSSVATNTNGVFYEASPSTLSSIYQDISTEF